MEQAWKQNAATWSQKLNTLFLRSFFDDFGASWVDNGSKQRARKGHESPKESSWNRHGSKMQQHGAKT